MLVVVFLGMAALSIMLGGFNGRVEYMCLIVAVVAATRRLEFEYCYSKERLE